jgi:hypothetical protein
MPPARIARSWPPQLVDPLGLADVNGVIYRGQPPPGFVGASGSPVPSVDTAWRVGSIRNPDGRRARAVPAVVPGERVRGPDGAQPGGRRVAASHHASTRVPDRVSHLDGSPAGTSVSNQTRPG